MAYIFKHKLGQMTHPITRAYVNVPLSNGQYWSESRPYRKYLKTLTRKQRQATVKVLKNQGVKYNA